MAQEPKRAAEGGTLLTVALCCCVAVFEGIDLQAAGVAAPKLAPAFHMAKDVLGWFFSMSTFGLLIGAAIGGRASDYFGRKAVIIASLTGFGLLTVATALSPSIPVLMVTRFLTGVGLGGALPNILALAAENTPPSRRNTALGVLYGCMPTGGALASLITVFSAAADWRVVFYVGGIAPLVLAPVLLFALPESRELKRVREQAADQGLLPRGIVFALFKDARAGRTALLWGAFFLALASMYILLNWLPTLWVTRGLKGPEASLAQVSFNVFGAAASALTGLCMDRMSLNKVVFGAFLSAAIGLIVWWLAPVGLPLSLAVGGLVGATISTTQALLYAIAPSTYPTQVRGTGVGAAVAVGRLGSAVGPLAAGLLLSRAATPQQVIMLLIPTILVAGAAALALSLIIGGRVRTTATEAAATAH